MTTIRPEHVLLVFVDGVGIGPASKTNPLARALLGFEFLSGGSRWVENALEVHKPEHVFKMIDATLGLPGLPQSGTGQATIFTGVNCAEVAGRHFGPFPHTTSRPLIQNRNLLILVANAFGTEAVAFANAFPARFLSYMTTSNRWTVTTACCRAAGVRLRDGDDLIAGRAVAADLTGGGWERQTAPPVVA
ncbi:hypothetical protein BH23BAC4_BH23BAC4_13710 [soil metagenome]